MKKIILLAAGIVFTAGMASAQKVDVRESNEKIGDGSHNALVVTILDAKPDDILDEWKSKMRSYDAKTSTKNGVFADNALIKTMGTNTVDVYARVEKVKEGETKLIVGFDLGGAWLNSSQHGEQYKEARKIVQEFAVKMTKDAIAGQLKEQQKKLEALGDDQKDLEKDNSKLKESIEDYKAKIKKAEEDIKKAEDDIKKNEEAQSKKKAEIEAQKKVVEAVDKKVKDVN